MDRAVVLELRRKLKNEKVQRLRHADPTHFAKLVRMLARLAEDHGDAIGQARPELPESLHDRAQDNWEPLLAIADLAGGNWPRMARNIAVRSAGNDEDVEISTMLLSDIQGVFNDFADERIDGKTVKRITTQILLVKLCADDTQPWITFDKNSGKMTPGQLARQLKAFGIKPIDLKYPGNVVQKGYRLDQFEDTFTRYLTSKAAGGSTEEENTSNPPHESRYPATREYSCGSTGSGPVAVADENPLPAEDDTCEVASETATSYQPATHRTAPPLVGSGVAAKTGEAELFISEPDPFEESVVI
jgi:putative DNA primase/helicase